CVPAALHIAVEAGVEAEKEQIGGRRENLDAAHVDFCMLYAMTHGRQGSAGGLDGGDDLRINFDAGELIENDTDLEFARRSLTQAGVGLGGSRDDKWIASLWDGHAV